MHLAIICEEFPPAPHGGTGSSYADLAACLSSAGHRVTVVGISTTLPVDRPLVEKQGDIVIHRLPRASKALRTRLGAWEERHRIQRWLKRIHRRNPIDLVEASDYHGWSSEVNISGVPVVVRIRGSNLFFDAELKRQSSAPEKCFERKALERSDFLGAVSSYAAGRTLEVAGLTGRPCEVIPNAVDTDFFSPDLMVKVDPGLILFVNSVSPRKGIESLLKACNTVFRNHENARLVIIGNAQGPNGGKAYRESLVDLVERPYRDRIDFKGRLPRPEIRDWLRQSAVCCYPSLMETFGIAPLEAMACGRPTVFSTLGPGPELIEHGVTGLLCDPRKPDDLARQICTILDSPETTAALGEQARRKAESIHSIPVWLKRNLEYFESCIEQGPFPRKT